MYLRVVQVAIEGGKIFTYDGRKPEYLADGRGEGPGLRIRFRTQQGDKSTPNVLRVDIFNLSDASAHPALHVGRKVTLSAGYGDGSVYVLFKGEVKQARENMRDDVLSPDSYLALLATDGSTPRNFAVVNKTLSAGHTHYDRVMVAAEAYKALGAQIGFIDKDALSKTKFTRGYAAFGMAKDLLRASGFATKTSPSIQNGVFQMVADNKAKPGSAITLNGRTGLIGKAVQTIRGVEGKSLLNGLIVPTCALKIDNASIQKAEIDPSYAGAANNNLVQLFSTSTDGTYKVFYVTHSGDTRGEEFYTDFIAVAMSAGTVSYELASRGIATPDAGH